MKTKPILLSIFLLAAPAFSACYTSAGTRTDAVDHGLDQEPAADVAEPEPDATAPDLPDIVDMPVEDTVEEELPPFSCIPQLSHIFSILGEGADSGPDERPEVITLRDGSFYLLARRTDESDGSHRLTAVKVTNAGTRGSDPVVVLMAQLISGFHPLFPVQSGMVTLHKDEINMASGKIFIQGYVPGEAPSVVIVLESSTGGSLWPTGADNGEGFFVAWSEQSLGSSRILGTLLRYDVTELFEPVDLAGDMNGTFDRPDAAFSGSHYLVASVYNRDPLMPSEADELFLVLVDETGLPMEIDRLALFAPEENRIVGRPVVQWAGDRWVVLWQEARDGSTAGSWLHLTIKVPSVAAQDHGINALWSDLVTDFSGDQPGELDMVWTGQHLGVLLKHDGEASGKKIYFKEIDRDGNALGPTLLINPGASASYNPSLTYMENARERYYLFAWLNYQTSLHAVQTATYGCTQE